MLDNSKFILIINVVREVVNKGVLKMMTMLLLPMLVAMGLFGLVWSVLTDSFETVLGRLASVCVFSILTIVSGLFCFFV